MCSVRHSALEKQFFAPELLFRVGFLDFAYLVQTLLMVTEFQWKVPFLFVHSFTVQQAVHFAVVQSRAL